LPVNFWGVQRTQISGVWPLVEGKLQSALNYGTSSLELSDLWIGFLEGSFQLWCAWEDDQIIGVVVTKVVETPKAKMCRIFIVTGDRLDEWIHFRETIEEWARSRDCTHVIAAMRPGYTRKDLPGYRARHVEMEKKL
jgi:hypothetical protein